MNTNISTRVHFLLDIELRKRVGDSCGGDAMLFGVLSSREVKRAHCPLRGKNSVDVLWPVSLVEEVVMELHVSW